MWTCPKCGREFKRTNQGHYCGEAPGTVDDYIGSQSAESQGHAAELRSIILRSVPGLTERIAWSMPRYEKDKNFISFAVCKKHISLYIETEIPEIFKPQLSGFEIKKSAVYLPFDRPLPEDVLESIVKQCFGETETENR